MKLPLRRSPKKVIIASALLLLLTPAMAWQQDTSVIKPILDLSNGWLENKDGTLQLIGAQAKSRNAVHFYLNQTISKEGNLFIQLPKETSLWIDNRLVNYFEQDTTLNLAPTLLLDGKAERLISVYGKNLNRNNLQTKLIRKVYAESRPIPVKFSPTKKQYLLIAFLLGMGITALFKLNAYNTLSEYFSISRTVSTRNREELIFKAKLLSSPNPIFYLVNSYFASYLMVALLLLIPDTFSLDYNISSYSLGELFTFQLILLAGFYGWTIAKWILIRYLSSLFKLSDFSTIHFFNYERFSLLILLLFSSLVTLLFFSVGSRDIIYVTLVVLIVIAATLRILLMLFKLLNGSTYKFLHLFSYLCATEIIPYLFAIKLILI